MTVLVIKIVCLFLAVLFTSVNGTKQISGSEIPAMNFWLQAIGITGFVVCQWLL